MKKTQKIPESMRILEILDPLWPDQRSQLEYTDCFELLVAVILSAQCTDEQVNKASKELFRQYPDVAAMAIARQSKIEELVYSTGFYRNKAKNIIATAKILLEKYGGRVPDNIPELVQLPGVGRKTANLVISVCYDKPGIVVDTHVLRIARRLGIAPTDDPVKSEMMIGKSISEEYWTRFSNVLNRQAKFFCTARKPKCNTCVLAPICPSAFII